MCPTDIIKPKRALLSVYHKAGIADFARALADIGAEIISSGGTATALKNEGIPVTEISDYTGAVEMFSGRVKTLQPKIHGGILARRPEDVAEMEKHNIPPIDIVCVNLYPFQKTVSMPDVTLTKALENIDIGGPAMIRAAAKNFPSVCVITDPSQYGLVTGELRDHGGITLQLREAFARAAFHLTASYDSAIARYFRSLPPHGENEDRISERSLPAQLPISLKRVSVLRYGENPHQHGAYYRIDGDPYDYITNSEILQGREISYNNILDIDAVVRICREFPGQICAAVVKHQNPTGVAINDTAEKAYRAARSVDELAAFGNVTGISGVVDEAAAVAINEAFVEVVVAADFTPEALEILKKKKNLRLVKTDLIYPMDVTGKLEGRALVHGVLVQEIDMAVYNKQDFKVVSKRRPTSDELRAMELGWRVVKHVRSNATVLATPSQTVGTGPGMTARIDTFKIAIEKAGEKSTGSVAATDGFCFHDSVEISHANGVTAIIEPGGGKSDAETIAKADELGMAIVMTGMRHFKH